MKKRTMCLIIIWTVLCLMLAIMYPSIKDAANSSRYSEAVGGEAFLWLMPSEVVLALSMLWNNKENADG